MNKPEKYPTHCNKCGKRFKRFPTSFTTKSAVIKEMFLKVKTCAQCCQRDLTIIDKGAK